MSKEWKVGELAALTGLTVRTLRYYDQIGLFSPSGHTESGHRLYTESDIARLQQILSLKELGLPLDQIKSVLAGEALSLFDLVSLQIARLKETISVQQKLLRELEQISVLMRGKDRLTVEDFTQIFRAMRMSHEQYFAERQKSWNMHLDRLGDYLGGRPNRRHEGGKPNE